MECFHHAIMSEKWMREHGYPEDMVEETLFWTMAPDMYTKVIGYQYRPLLHLEDPGYEGCAIHKTRENLAALYTSPCVPIPSKFACAARIGMHLHLVQDRAYDAWISQWIRAKKNEDGQWVYHAAHTGEELDWYDIEYLKRWSWRCGYVHEIGDMLSASDLAGDTMPDVLMHYIDITKTNQFFHPAMKSALGALWQVEMKQVSVPDEFADVEEELYTGLQKAWTAWKDVL